MKKLIIIAALVVASAVPAMAQSSRYRTQRGFGGQNYQNYTPPGVSQFDQNMIDREAVPSSV